MKKFAIIAFILCLSSLPAHAQERQYSGGMKYTTMSPANPKDNDKKPIYNQKAPEAEADTATQEPETTPPAQSAWDQYKELATGKTPETSAETKTAPNAPEKPELPDTATAKANEPKKTTGLTAIIEDYRKNKEKRGQIRTITMTHPSRPTSNTPEVTAPTVAKPSISANN